MHQKSENREANPYFSGVLAERFASRFTLEYELLAAAVVVSASDEPPCTKDRDWLMSAQDLVVGGISLLAGGYLAAAAAVNQSFLFSLPRVEGLAQMVGRPVARVLLVLVGLGFILLGGALIFSGYKP